MKLQQHQCGIIYVAFGYDYLLMAVHSAATAKKTNPGIHCTVVTNYQIDLQRVRGEWPFDDLIIVEKDSKYNRLVKTNIIQYTSLERCLYLDCDTEVRGSLEPVFNCLDRFDLAMKLNFSTVKKEYEIAPGIPGRLFPVWNSGAIFFRNDDRVQEFFSRWSRFFMEEGRKSDQPALARAVYASPELRLLTLGPLWNAFPDDAAFLRNGIRDALIWHYRLPYRWPAVAPSLYQIHQHISPALINQDAALAGEIEDASRRYKFLASPFYRHGIGCPLFQKCKPLLKFFIDVAGLFKVKIKRDSQAFGRKYEHIDD